MHRHTWSGALAAAVFAASGVVIAQSPASAPSSQTPAASSSQPAPSTASTPAEQTSITVTGCLREATAGATGTSGTAAPSSTDAASKASAATKYVVADAVPSAGNPSASAAPQTYQLIANDAALAPHVGKKLEFTGTIESAEAAATGQPRLRVEKASVLSGDCNK